VLGFVDVPKGGLGSHPITRDDLLSGGERWKESGATHMKAASEDRDD
jgi:hypothetical protein